MEPIKTINNSEYELRVAELAQATDVDDADYLWFDSTGESF